MNFPLRDLDLREFASENTSKHFSAGSTEPRHGCLSCRWEAPRWWEAAEEREVEIGRRCRTEKGRRGEGARDTLGLDTSGFLFRPRCLQPVRCVQSLRNHHGRPLHSLLPKSGDRRVAHFQRLQVRRASGRAPGCQTPVPHPGAVRARRCGAAH